jgi:polynucleotide 5'-hydroxyl-kinase GRC3/NOL9
MTVPPGWDLALARAADRRVTMLVGGVDTGKTTLATFLANGLRQRGLQVGVVDADLGQSEIGPPTTIGLGLAGRPLDRLGDAEVAGLSFVGSTSPRGVVAATVAGTRQMVERGTALGLGRIIVDTSGLIDGPLGRTLKARKIEAVGPDLLVCLERDGECGFVSDPSALILRLPVGEHVRSRSTGERRRHRDAALEAYFRNARSRRLAVSRLTFRSMADGAVAETRHDLELEGALVGLDDEAGHTLGLGVVRAADDRCLLIDTPVYDVDIAGVRLGGQDSVHRLDEVTR